MKYRKKPIVVNAIQWTGKNIKEIEDFAGEFSFRGADENGTIKLRLSTREGMLDAVVGDYIIRGIHGEYYPCGEEIFKKTYEEVND